MFLRGCHIYLNIYIYIHIIHLYIHIHVHIHTFMFISFVFGPYTGIYIHMKGDSRYPQIRGRAAATLRVIGLTTAALNGKGLVAKLFISSLHRYTILVPIQALVWNFGTSFMQPLLRIRAEPLIDDFSPGLATGYVAA